MATQKPSKLKIFIIDDDQLIIDMISTCLDVNKYAINSTTDSTVAFELIQKQKPDIIIADLLMPKVDGLLLCKMVRENADMDKIKFIMISSKAYEFDEKRSYEFGADGYIRKPIEHDSFNYSLDRIIEDKIHIKFWGVRGTLPVTGEKSLRYGGNTSCVTLEFPRKQFFIFDGGSGVKNLGDWILKTGLKRINAKVFISHPHWDHINALPFFTPLYIQGNEIEILGPNQGDITMRELISSQMDGVYFPITFTEFAGRIYFSDLDEETIKRDGIEIQTKLLSHPGKCLGYRVNYNGRSVCYITDNELFLESSPFYDAHYVQKLIEFCSGADVLITDSTYSDEEYKTKESWEHSCISQVADLADRAQVKALYLFHHDPAQNDDDIDLKLKNAQKILAERNSKTQVFAPSEGDRVDI